MDVRANPTTTTNGKEEAETRNFPNTEIEISLKVDRDWGCCILTYEPMRYPVKGKDGQDYEASVLLEHCRSKGNVSPYNNGPILPVVLNYTLKEILDNNPDAFPKRAQEYDIKPVMEEFKKLEKEFAVESRRPRQRNQQQQPFSNCNTPWAKSGLKAVGTAFSLSFMTYLAYTNLHSGAHNASNAHTEEDLMNSLTAPVFYAALFLDLGFRKVSRHQFGIFGATANAIRILCSNYQPHAPDNNNQRRGPQNV